MIPSLEPPPGTPAPGRCTDAPAPGTLLSPPPGHHAFCYGCGQRHPAGLHLQVRAGAGVRVSAEFEVGELHQGPPGLAHGGVLAAVFDEVLNYLVWMLREPAVTARLVTRYRRPVPVGSRLHVAAECLGVSGRKVFGRAAGRLGSPAGNLRCRRPRCSSRFRVLTSRPPTGSTHRPETGTASSPAEPDRRVRGAS